MRPQLAAKFVSIIIIIIIISWSLSAAR